MRTGPLENTHSLSSYVKHSFCNARNSLSGPKSIPSNLSLLLKLDICQVLKSNLIVEKIIKLFNDSIQNATI